MTSGRDDQHGGSVEAVTLTWRQRAVKTWIVATRRMVSSGMLALLKKLGLGFVWKTQQARTSAAAATRDP